MDVAAAGITAGYRFETLPAEVMMRTDMDYDSIAKAGSMLGSGAVIVMDEDTCMVKAAERLAYFYYEESCGQCTPCREGTGWIEKVLYRMSHGLGSPSDLDLLIDVGAGISPPADATHSSLAAQSLWPRQRVQTTCGGAP